MTTGILAINAAVTTSPYTLPYQSGGLNGAFDFALLQITGAISANWTAYAPGLGLTATFVVQNLTTGGYDVLLLVKGQTGVILLPGVTALCYLDGADVVFLMESGGATGPTGPTGSGSGWPGIMAVEWVRW